LLHRWFAYGKDVIDQPIVIVPGPRVRQLGPVLAIEAVTPEDGKLTLHIANMLHLIKE